MQKRHDVKQSDKEKGTSRSSDSTKRQGTNFLDTAINQKYPAEPTANKYRNERTECQHKNSAAVNTRRQNTKENRDAINQNSNGARTEDTTKKATRIPNHRRGYQANEEIKPPHRPIKQNRKAPKLNTTLDTQTTFATRKRSNTPRRNNKETTTPNPYQIKKKSRHTKDKKNTKRQKRKGQNTEPQRRTNEKRANPPTTTTKQPDSHRKSKPSH
ncbi:hypothetical protein M407DRAFT_6663 [Tulasnella calospora MUT 4182]|uniref:Uncharacterized protein n=1 Tax=Tulasnella calospora MUT 4182 TaxID=1051891 RepID=A0A0C3QNF8_9AGAM|nr:hypothetical protein M407DRAFT_6663 [Tulasnella calospora MUT 4182]